MFKFWPGKAPPARDEPYPEDELGVHDRKTAKYFVAGGFFLVLGSLHMVVKNLPWVAEYLAQTGYAGHLVRDLSNTHVMIVGGGTLLATGLCWYVLPRIVGRPLASEGLAQCAFWFTAAGLAVFYVSLVGNGVAIGRLVEHGRDYQLAKEHMGKWYKVPTGVGAGVMGLGYWCFAANVCLTIFQSRLVKVPKPQWHLWKFLATGAVALTVGTVQGVIQVQPANADWLYKAKHAGEWIDPISHAHINLVTGLTMLVAGAFFALLPALGGRAPSRRLANLTFGSLLAGSLAFYASALYLGLHEGRLVHSGLTPEQAEEATPLHPYLIMGAGIAMFAAFWLLRAVTAVEPWQAFVLVPAACAVLIGFSAYARAAWRMTSAQRAAAREALRTTPARYTGKIPRRVRRRSPAALAGYELPLAVMGFPGVGWLFAGFPFTASILLLVGPAAAWAVVPISFSPYGGPLREIG